MPFEDKSVCPITETPKEPSIYAVSKQIGLSIGNDLATDFPYSMNKITL